MKTKRVPKKWRENYKYWNVPLGTKTAEDIHREQDKKIEIGKIKVLP